MSKIIYILMWYLMKQQKCHLPVFSSSVLGVLGLLIITTKWLSTRGIYFDVSGPETYINIIIIKLLDEYIRSFNVNYKF